MSTLDNLLFWLVAAIAPALVGCGHCESIADGRGLWHRTTKANIKIALCHKIDPVFGYVLDVFTKPHGGEARCAAIVFSLSEAVGLCCALEASMGLVAFGVPPFAVLGEE